jgi:hypothetical protein
MPAVCAHTMHGPPCMRRCCRACMRLADGKHATGSLAKLPSSEYAAEMRLPECKMHMHACVGTKVGPCHRCPLRDNMHQRLRGTSALRRGAWRARSTAATSWSRPR